MVYQTSRFEAYQGALDRLTRLGLTYPCGCTRKDAVCTCHAGLPPGRAARSIRLRVPEGESFPLLRADGIWSYQLAVVVDDAWQQITHVVRGADLLDSTPRQILLQQMLGLPRVTHAHIPVVLGADGQKLSKQTKAPPVDIARPGAALLAALRFLNQPVPESLEPHEIVGHAVQRWSHTLKD